ncbi:MAG: type I methionyl aminopeptidase [Elusimicrobiota bacterium]
MNLVSRKPGVELKTAAEVSLMRKAGELAGLTLKEVEKHIAAGVSTQDLDKVAEIFIKKNGGIPTFIGYRGYPATLCVSINQEVVHGIPNSRTIIKEGDVVSVDVAATVDGFVGDTAFTKIVGHASSKDQKLVDVTKASLDAAIAVCQPGMRLGDIGFAVQTVAEAAGFGVVRDFVGHGIGRKMHEEPAVPNYGKPGTGLRLEIGMVIAIEPMVTSGSWKVKVLKDGWTVVTEDGSNAAHFEHTVAITDKGPIVLTQVV